MIFKKNLSSTSNINATFLLELLCIAENEYKKQAHSSSTNLKERLNSPRNVTFSSVIPAISHALK